MKTAVRLAVALLALFATGARAEPAKVLFVAGATIGKAGEDLGRPKLTTALGAEATAVVGSGKDGPAVGFSIRVDDDPQSPGGYTAKLTALVDGKPVGEQVKTFRPEETPWFGIDANGFSWSLSINRMLPPKPDKH